VLFIPDGLRALIVSEETAPTMGAIRDKGVNFKNPHALFPTFTTPNAAAMATGHYPGDTGDFSNTIYAGFPVPGAGNTITPFLESDPVLGDVDEHFAGDYLDEVTLLKAARDAGVPRRQRQSRQCHDTGHESSQYRAARLFRRCRHQGRSAAVQGAQSSLCPRVLVARP